MVDAVASKMGRKTPPSAQIASEEKSSATLPNTAFRARSAALVKLEDGHAVSDNVPVTFGKLHETTLAALRKQPILRANNQIILNLGRPGAGRCPGPVF